MNREYLAPKVPAVFAAFWVAKLLTTGIGETGSDYLGSVNLVLAGLVGLGGFVLALRAQLRADRYHPLRYWLTVLMVAVFGTMIADGPHMVLGAPYWVDSILYLLALVGVLAWWYRSEGTLSVHSITTARRERFYWATVLLTFGLGTALGDTTAANLHMGFVWSIVLFGVLIVLPLVAWRAGANAVLCFWASYSLTRPLGASVADWVASRAPAGLGLGTGPVTAVGLVLFAGIVGYLVLTHADEEPAAEVERRDEVSVAETASRGV